MTDDNDDQELSFEMEQEDGQSLGYAEARAHACGEITKYAVDMLDYYQEHMPANEALAMVIESLSVSLGNLISLVKEDHQNEVIEDAKQVIQLGLLAQTEVIASMAYGQIGHC